MSDIKDVRLLWTKGGLFLMLGCTASGLLLLMSPNFESAILLAIAVWAFCRAYYFAFYVIEKYVDPGFRFAGLSSFLRYAIQGPERYRLSQDYHASLLKPDAIEIQPMSAIRWKAFKWFAFGSVLNLVIPSAYRFTSRFRFRYLNDFEVAIWIGWCVMILSLCVISAALFRAPRKLTIPISFGALLGLTLALLLGNSVASGWNYNGLSILLILAPLAFLLGFAIAWFYGRKTHYQLVVEQPTQWADSQARDIGNEQLSIRYMFVATTVIAVSLVLVKQFIPSRSSDFPPIAIFLHICLIGCGIGLTLSMIAISTLHVVLSTDRQRRRSHALLITASLILLPWAVLYAVSQIPAPTGMASNRNPSYEEYCSMYLFFWSYVLFLMLALFSFSTVGLRLVRQPS